jgi:hypothetical protein
MSLRSSEGLGVLGGLLLQSMRLNQKQEGSPVRVKLRTLTKNILYMQKNKMQQKILYVLCGRAEVWLLM